jgi:integrase/recombinase XerD
MAQAKTFTKGEFEMILEFVSQRRFALRNRMLILMSFWSGMRVGEIASLRVEDVVDRKGKVKSEIRLDASQTKGKQL